ncbi:MAG: helix-turn-helix transcriptional regulator [Negativicutes bacterium]|nr:helix-turn-helix transcriptional regulator [Negativicutes bacterium]WMJ82556.1 helix-turn-helix transcriptional regulator [Oscillospiraceae bacterium MB24-C1]
MKNASPVYECILTANEQGSCLILNSVTEAFCRVVGISPHSLGMPLEKVVAQKTAAWIYQAFSYIKDGNEAIRDLREIQGSFWCYSLAYNKPKLTVSLSPIWDVDEANRTYSVNNLANMSLNKFHGSFHDSLLINCNESNYKIASISPALSQLLGITIGDNIDTLFSYMQNLCTDRLIKRSMELNKVHYYMDVYEHDKTTCHLLITLIPLNHFERYMLIGLHKLQERDYYQMMKSIDTSPRQICEAGNIGVAVIETENCKYKRIINANTCFNRLVYSHEDFELLRIKIIPVCCAKQSILTASRRLGNLNCLIAAIPTLNSNQIFLFIIPDTGPQPSIQSLANRLTKREFEIACHIVNGNSIKGISADCGISEGTVKKNLSNIYSKLQINNRVDLVRLIFPTVIN